MTLYHFRCDMELSDWVISTLERKQPIPRIKSSSKRARNCILQKLDYDPMGKHTKRIEKLGVLFIDTIKAGIIYLSMVKDLVLYSLLVYTSKYILLHRFETVDGYDMDKVAIYLIFVVTSSKLALVILQLANWNVLHGYCYNRPPGSHLLIKICAVIFPFHITLFVWGMVEINSSVFKRTFFLTVEKLYLICRIKARYIII